MDIKSYINKVLEDNKYRSFTSILAGIVATKLGDPYLNENSVKLCLDLKDELTKALQEMIRHNQVEYDSGFRKKNNETNTSSGDQP